MGEYDKFNEAMKDAVPEECRERLPDECEKLGDEISRLAGTLDVLRDRLSFVLADGVDTVAREDYAPFGPNRSGGSHLLRELRIRLDRTIQGVEDLIQRLDL